ncbi:MAG: hypothetical protein AUJ74_06165 [Candidatus Omnitrophica bacterium CG1_02_44_16]|nr:MAG: hypothetical protein AUJ74_06165 [Candidatus Omnitrophica bacterium CG1_02_44_16]PIY83045.1 MAG: carbamoyltransferase [Candidatus Omnitrophica bacterium CG_4_10_14_0_8_um_filter_44_12]PIZ83372.1 MAG: carbamoyltransferase [Candidatus Omnitrophica bacterium CG_4_10_14_0_2_um_filter_44_9]
MKILGLAAPFGNNASAALLIDGKIVTAAEEDRFTREKHAPGQCPANAVRFCLETAGIKPSEVDIVACLSQGQKTLVNNTLSECNFSIEKTKIERVEHPIAHIASSFYFSGFKEAAILLLDGCEENISIFLGSARGKEINRIKKITAPDSLGDFYAAATGYLGFKREDGGYEAMGMAPYGDPKKINFDHTDSYEKLLAKFGPKRTGDKLSEPYIHIAAAAQAKLEEITLRLIDSCLLDELKRHGTLCFAGSYALNISLNRKLLEHPYIKNIWVQPAANDAGASLGAAAYAAAKFNENIEPMEHVYLGPGFSDKEIEKAIKVSGFTFEKPPDICQRAAELLAQGKIVGWFQGRMEWGPRALGNRSILGNPSVKGTNDKINAIIKFREKWRPFCPSILEEYAQDILGSKHPSPFMTLSFNVTPQWKNRIPEAVHVDGTARPQVVSKNINPKFYSLIKDFHKKTGIPVVINTSLNRRGEPMVCAPKDALTLFKETGLENLAIGDFLVTKNN